MPRPGFNPRSNRSRARARFSAGSGRLAIHGARLSVSPILECLAADMTLQDIDEAFDRIFPREALPEVLKVAAEVTNSIHVAA